MTTVARRPRPSGVEGRGGHGLRVAMVSARFPPQLGGTETHTSEVARRLARRGLDVTVLATDVDRRLPTVEGRGPLSVRRFPARPRSTDLYASPGLAREVARGGYDLVHVQGVHTLVPPMALAAAQRAGIPTVVTFHTGGHSGRLRARLRGAQWRALGPLLRRSDALIAVSNHEAALFAGQLDVEPSEIRLVRNGADPLPCADRAPEVAGTPLICSIGRLERYKGHQRVVAAMPDLLATAPDAHLAIVGRGPYERSLRRLASRLGVDHAVTVTAFDATDREGLGALVRSSDVVALLSDYEAHPVALLEALALGRKVVVAATSGLTELADDGIVTTVPVDAHPTAVAAVLAGVAAAPAARVPELRTWDECADDVLRVYDQVVGARS